MELLIVLVATVAVCCALRTPIKKFPVLFYLLAIALDAVFVTGWMGVLPWTAWSALLLLVRRCALAFSLFAVVMFIGVLPRASKARAWLGPIRGELSVIACIIVLGHVAFYGASFFPRMIGGGIGDAALVASLCVAFVLVVLLVALGVTSLESVRTRMKAVSWRKLQRWAYAFYALTYVHIACALLPSALSGGGLAATNLAVYTVVFAAYVVLRLARRASDAKSAHEGVPAVGEGEVSPAEAARS